MINVYRKIAGVETEVCSVSDRNATEKTAIMGVFEYHVSIVVDEVLDIQGGDYIKKNGIIYTLNRDPEYTIESEVKISYDLVFEHPFYVLLSKLYCNRIIGYTTFTLTGKLRDFVELVVWCVNISGQNPEGVDTGWTVGEIIDTEYKNLQFSDMDCKAVLDMLADVFQVEFFFNNKQINYVERVERTTDFVFEQGAGKGLFNLSQQPIDKEDTVTRLLVRGGNQNVPNANADEEGYLKLPENYLENFSEHSKVVEKKKKFEEEFPKFVGTVATVSGENNKILTCPQIDFDVAVIAVGDNARINFLTGDLMGGPGYKFKWNNANKQITLIEQDDEIALSDADGNKPKIPNSTKNAKVGDTFNFTGVLMPESYVTASTNRLRAKGAKYLNLYSKKRVKFTLDIDHRYLRNKSALKVGDLVVISIPQKSFSQVIRITQLERNLHTGAISATVSNYLEENWEKYVSNKVDEVRNEILAKQVNVRNTLEAIFKDGIITESELKIIESVLERLYIERGQMNAQYLVVRGNINLINKTPLTNAWDAYQASYINVRDAINSAIADGEITEAEKIDIDNKISAYSTQLNGFSSALEQAREDIENYKNQAILDVAQDNINYLQQQIDGEISNWFYAYSPTLSNYPASDWTTTTEKDRHIGDTFTNMQPSPAPDAGKSWRFVKNGSVYSWTLIADSDAVKALQQAALAQATADGKSTTFLVQPSNYHLGDTWVLNADRTVNGTAYKQGEILTATQDSTTFVEAHWIKRVRYTDDTAVDNLEIGGRNIFAASKSGLSEITSSEEFTTNMWAANVLPNSYVKIAFLPATSYIMSYEVEIIEKFERVSLTQAHAQFALYNGTTLINMGSITHSQYENSVVGDKFLVRRIFTTPSDLSGYYVIGYATRYNDPVANVLMTFRNVQIEKGNKVTDWSPAPEDVQASISDAKQAGMDAQSSAIAAQNAVDDLDEYMGGAFKDGVVSEAEAKAIEKYLNTLNETMSKTEASYNKVYANTYLEGAAKTALLNAKINLWGQRDTLTSAINTAIAGGSTTPAQKTAVDNAFATFNSLMSAFQNALEEANKAIQTKLDNIAKGYVDDLQIGGRNYYSLQNIIANGDFRDKIFTLEPDTEYMAQATIPRPSPALMDCWAASGNSPSRNSATNGVASDAPRKVTSDANGNIWVSFRGTHYDNVINGTYKIWVTKGNKAVDWSEAQEDVQLKITEAKQVGEAAQTAAGTAQATANSLKNFTDTAFADGIVNRSERVAIEKYLNSVNETKLTVDSSYTQVYNNAYLSGTPKTNLQTAKTALNTAYTNLVNSINTAISDNVATPAEKADVDAKYGLFNTALATYQVRLEEANNAIGKGRIDDLDYIGVNLFSDMSTSRIAAWINTSNVIAAASDSYLIAIPVQPNSVYTLSADLQGSTLCRTGYITGSTVIGSTVLSSNRDTVLPRTINTGANATYVVIQVSTSYGAAIKRTVKLEKGTRATPWVANQMDAIISKAITDKFGTTIDGGLVSAVMLVLRALDSQTVTAGISGIQGANRDNPAFWAGGTYDKAFALIQFLSKMSAGTTPVSDEYNNLAKVTILHDGAAKVGDFIILKTGEIVMIDPATGGERLKFNVENLPPIASLVSGVTDGGGPVNIGAGTISYPNNQIALSGSLNVGRDGSVLTYNASQLRVEVHRSTGMASGTARLVLYRDGSPHMELSFVTISVSSGESDARDVTVSRSIPVSAGTYTLRLEFGFDVNTVYGYASVTAGTMSWSYSAAGVRRQQYGLNGMMFFYSNHHFHFTEGGGLDGRALPDKWNTPGVLLSATVASGGGWSDVWGSKQSSTPASKNSSGRYTVYHTIGHAKYQVSASSLVANRSYHIVSQSATNFVIEWRTIGSSPALIDTTFHIQVTGNNYNT